MNKKLAFVCLALAGTMVFGSCKPKQSAYKSVYETAKEREMETSKPAEPSTEVIVPEAEVAAETVRKEKITPVYDTDATSLKSYSVVVAAMGMRPNAESLKERLEDAGYKVILAQNEKGMFRVLIASAESKEQAVAKKRDILSRFDAEADLPALKAKYGIPFDDWWILQRD